jgi:AraC family transcriptional regulator
MDKQQNTNMQETIFMVRNMVCTCCIAQLRQTLEKLPVTVLYVHLGEVAVRFNPDIIKRDKIEKVLIDGGFEPLVEKEKILVEQIKLAIIELIHYAGNKNSIIRNSDYLVEKTGFSYPYLSAVFSTHENITLEKFIILHKIEKVKELLEYGELTLSEISYMMEYSSVQYLSTQFRSITGVSVTDYKKQPSSRRKPIHEIGK